MQHHIVYNIALLAIGVFLGIAWDAYQDPQHTKQCTLENAETANLSQTIYNIPTNTGRIRKQNISPVVIVWYGDYTDPISQKYSHIFKELNDGNSYSIYFHHYPNSPTEQALDLAIAAVAAEQQKKFWQMHDALMVSEPTVDPLQLANSIGIDTDLYTQQIQNPSIAASVYKELHQANRVGITSVPTIFINGRRYIGSANKTSMQEALDFAEREANKLINQGMSKQNIYQAIMLKAKPLKTRIHDGYASIRHAIPLLKTEMQKQTYVHVNLFTSFGTPLALHAYQLTTMLQEKYKQQLMVHVFYVDPWQTETNQQLSLCALLLQSTHQAEQEMPSLFEHYATYESIGKPPELLPTQCKNVNQLKKQLDQLHSNNRLYKRLKNKHIPLLFINGIEIPVTQPPQVFDSIIAQEIAKATTFAQAGLEGVELYNEMVLQPASFY